MWHLLHNCGTGILHIEYPVNIIQITIMNTEDCNTIVRILIMSTLLPTNIHNFLKQKKTNTMIMKNKVNS